VTARFKFREVKNLAVTWYINVEVKKIISLSHTITDLISLM